MCPQSRCWAQQRADKGGGVIRRGDGPQGWVSWKGRPLNALQDLRLHTVIVTPGFI